MNLRLPVITALALVVALNFSCKQQKQENKPNIIVIYVDDLGYGDLSCYGATEVQTPNVDFLASNGLKFTDAHSTAATCTPSRFSLLTGSYAFRNDAAILPGDAPLLIRPETPTLPAMLKKAGYATGVVGKWHLGLGDGVIDWNTEIKPGPLEIGFDYSFLIPATQDRVPTVYVENRRVVGLDPNDPIKVSYKEKIGDLPTGLERPDLLKFGADTQHSNTITDGISRIGYMTGGKTALWKDQEIPDVLIGKVNEFLNINREKPFFLYFSLTDIHVPRDPNPRFVGKTKMGSRGDNIVQMDWLVGQVTETLKKLNLSENTLVIFTSDNGPVLDDGYTDFAVEKLGSHKPAGPFKGGKYSAYEGGTRMPTIVYWPAKVAAGQSDALMNQVDLYASLASLTGHKLQNGEAPDSFDFLDAWTGKSKKGREYMLEESFTMSLRMNEWKYIAPQTKGTPDWLRNKNIAVGLQTTPQLYNLKNDIAEEDNVLDAHPDIVQKMKAELEKILTNKGSRPAW